jgi:beta-lactamase regulating signal transducer with metallopeptidase domain
MDKVFSTMLEIGIYSGVIVLIVLILRLVFHKASKTVICALWFLVGLRLLLFVPIESSFAIMPRLSIKETVREYSESTEMIQLQGTDGIAISDNGLNEDGSVVPAQNNSDNQDSAESIVGLKSGNAYKYENSESSKSSNDEELIRPTQETLSSKSAQTKQENRSNIFSILTFVWLGGTLVMFSYAIIKAIKVKKHLSEAVRLEGYDDVYLTDYVRNAFVFGLVRPRIYLNYSVTDEQREYVLAHEREHIARKDYFFKVLAYVLLSLYWFVPWIWVAFIIYSRDMELACDEGVIRTMDPESRARYAETLFGCSVSGFGRAYNAVSFGELGVNERVKNIMKYKKKTIWISVAAGIVAVLCLVFFLTPKDANAENQDGETQIDGTKTIEDPTVNNSQYLENEDNLVSDNGDFTWWHEEFYDKENKRLVLHDISSIPPRAFANCTEIKEVIIPDSVTSIGVGAFRGCTNLEKVTLPAQLLEIQNRAFLGCSMLKEIICPPNLEKIGDDAFAECRSLVNVQLSQRILRAGYGIGDDAFSKCYSLSEESKSAILSVSEKAYRINAYNADSDLMNVDYARKEEAPDKFQMRLDNPYDSFYVVIYAMDDGDIICEDYHSFPFEEKTDYTGNKKRYNLSDDCKIIVQAKDEGNNGKICYIDKDELAYIVRMYGFVRPDGSHESYVKSEYVYPFLCVMDQNHEVRCLRECYDIFEVSKNLLDKVKNVNYTPEQIEALDKKLKDRGETEYDICNMQELNVNKAGQTYGSWDLGADLIPAKGIDGVIGYINKEELEAPTVHTIEEALEQNKNAEKGKIIPLYDCEGEVIGGFCAGFVSDEEIEAYRNELEKME